jgi:uncharacterized lipoprotein YddW (UPF0748 family)
MLMTLALCALATLTAPAAHAAEVKVIDDFEYADAAALQQAWVPYQTSPPASFVDHDSQGGRRALALVCSFTKPDFNRAVYDRTVDLDLSRYGTLTFDFYAKDPDIIQGCTLYFHTGEGWYGCGFAAPDGWQHISLGKGSFNPEDKPGSWATVDSIRICAWKGETRDTLCAIDNLEARTEDVALIRGTPDAGNEVNTAQAQFDQLQTHLTAVDIPFGVLTDEDVEAGALAAYKVAVFGYSPEQSDALADAVCQFIAAGGKVIDFYSIHPRIAQALGLGELLYRKPQTTGEFARVVFDQAALQGLPATIEQDSWNMTEPHPNAANARVIGWWQNPAGDRTGSAVVVSDTGAYMAHVLTPGDDDAKRLFVVSLLGHFVPAVWQTAAQSALGGALRTGPFTNRVGLQQYLTEVGPRTGSADFILQKLQEADAAQQRADSLMADGQYAAVLTEAAALRQALSAAYFRAHTPRDGEFRAVWNHSGTGDCGTWDEAMRRLAEANFNAVVPNMWWGGIAYYDSKILPHAPVVAEQGDQIALAVAAGHKYGIEVHPWKVNWNLDNAPEDFVAQMRAEGRLQHNHSGGEIRWLCPSHPANFQLELDTMLEVVRNYDVDGVHFDYIRYPDGDSCYCDGCRERFQADTGLKVENWPADVWDGPLRQPYRDWRCEQITRLVKATYEEAHKLKPAIKISAAVWGEYPAVKDLIGQDWLKWVKNGWLDFVCPMDYSAGDRYFDALVGRQVGMVGGAIPLYAGIGQFIIPDDQVAGQIEMARHRGADGFILFNMGLGLATRTLPALVQGLTSAPACLPHNAPLFAFETPTGDATSGRVEVTVLSAGEHRQAVAGLSGEVQLQDLDGGVVQKLGEMPPVGRSLQVSLPAREGRFRVAVAGELQFADGSRQPFLRRSVAFGR